MNDNRDPGAWQDIHTVAVVGAKGMLGRDVASALKQCDWLGGDLEIELYDIDEIDIADKQSVAETLRLDKSCLVINCAAYTNVDGCETERELAFAVNGNGPGNLAELCHRQKAKLVHISTDFVFDGKSSIPYLPDDKTCPLSVYGQSKLAGEIAVTQNDPEHLIVRISWLFGKHGKNFVSTIAQIAGEKEYLEVVDDQIGSPTYTVDLAEAILHLVRVDGQGIYHFCNAGQCSWHGFAAEIVKQLGLQTPVRPIGSEQLSRPAARPGYSLLDISCYLEATGQTVRSWQGALADYLSTYKNQG